VCAVLYAVENVAVIPTHRRIFLRPGRDMAAGGGFVTGQPIKPPKQRRLFRLFFTQSLDMNGPSPYFQIVSWHSLGGSAKVNSTKIQSLGD
jgi:hypothetical protein